MVRGETEDTECVLCGTTSTEQLHAFGDYTVIVEAICETCRLDSTGRFPVDECRAEELTKTSGGFPGWARPRQNIC
jgi:hypothetical protein